MVTNTGLNVRRGLVCVFLLLVSLGAAPVNGQEVLPDIHYREIVLPLAGQEANSSSDVQVVELFSYACIHCYNIEPKLERWLSRKPDDVLFERIHVVFEQSQLALAFAYLTAEEFGVVDDIHMRMFAAIHEYGIRMNNIDLIGRLFEQAAGIEANLVQTTLRSEKIRQAFLDTERLMRLWRIDGTPSFVVDGRYLVTTSLPAYQDRRVEMLDIVDQLTDKVRIERTAPADEA